MAHNKMTRRLHILGVYGKEKDMQKVVICGVDTSGLPKLTAKENEELMQKLKAGDKCAREKFIVGNMRLV